MTRGDLYNKELVILIEKLEEDLVDQKLLEKKLNQLLKEQRIIIRRQKAELRDLILKAK